jgi:hypothetical protein
MMYCHSEVSHLTVDTFQDLVIGKEFLTNFRIYPLLIPDNILERGLISIKALPVTTLSAVVKREVWLISL